MFQQIIRPAVSILIVMTLLTGVIYPLVVTGIAQVIFPTQANGSLIHEGDQLAGSTLIGQPFDEAKYFWSRPSATGPYPYNASASSGSNLGVNEPNLISAVQDRIETLKKADPTNDQPIPVDLVTASASGLDPDISPAAAEYQAVRVAKARGLSERQVRTLIDQSTVPRQLGLLGEPRVNVLRLNRALDGLTTTNGS
jgi:K+-transporting ATPase ATPase C chain